MKAKITYERLYRRQKHYRIRNFVYSLVLVGVMVAAYFVMNDVLTVYENAQPKYVAKAVVDQLNEGDFSLFLNSRMQSPYAEETEEYYLMNIEALPSGSVITARESVETDVNKRRYNLYADGNVIAQLTLKRQDTQTKYGFNQWETESCPFTAVFVRPSWHAVRAPATSSVAVNGVLLTESDIAETYASEHSAHLPASAPSQEERLYRFMVYTEEPEIVVTDARNRLQRLTEADGVLTAERIDDELPEGFETVLKNTIEAVAQYSVGLKKEGYVLNYVVPKSAAAQNLHEYGKWKSKNAARGRFENFSYEGYVRVDEHIAYCRVKTDYICTYNAKDDTPYYLTYTMYFSDESGKWLLYDFVTQ